jgi:hypothetical protein
VIRRAVPRDPAANPFVKPGEKVERVEGVAKSLDCAGKGARFEVQVGQKVLTFDMPSPDRILLKHNNDVAFDFSCGPQKPVRVAIEYVPAEKGTGDVAGSIRKLEF